jgi:osmotically inducible protein OsmC
MKRSAQAVWKGPGKEGSGTLTSTSGALSSIPYSAQMRFEDESGRAGTNPEELIAAAHAGCFSMALAFQLAGGGKPPQQIDTNAEIDLVQESGGWTIRAVHLTVRAQVDGISAEEFQSFADKAKEGCPVSRALNAEITMDASLA